MLVASVREGDTMELTAAGPLDVVEVLGTERALLLDLLRSIEGDEWQRPTECPAYDVQGVAAHLLGDDLSLLSRQRDAALPGVLAVLQDGDDFRTALDRFNDQWVTAARFFSPAVLIDLLEVTGRWTSDWYAAVDLRSPGEPVGFFGGAGPAPYWQIAAREYVERWVHHHQIRRALGRDDIDDPAILHPAVATAVRGLAAHLHDLGAAAGTALVVDVEAVGAWTLRREGDGWQLFDGRAPDPAAEVGLARGLATPVFSRGLPADEVRAALSCAGDPDIAAGVASGIAALAGR
jgi:uncharacterized protein (TIGR03083 family)